MIDPAKSAPIEVIAVEGGQAQVKPVQFSAKVLELVMTFIFQQVPVETDFFVPFPPLTEFSTHEEQFLARMPHQISMIQSKVGPFLPLIPGHFIQQ